MPMEEMGRVIFSGQRERGSTKLIWFIFIYKPCLITKQTEKPTLPDFLWLATSQTVFCDPSSGPFSPCFATRKGSPCDPQGQALRPTSPCNAGRKQYRLCRNLYCSIPPIISYYYFNNIRVFIHISYPYYFIHEIIHKI